MSTPQPPKPRRPKGKALPLADTDLDRLATTSPDDLPSAVRFWERFAPKAAKGLLSARTEPPKDAP